MVVGQGRNESEIGWRNAFLFLKSDDGYFDGNVDDGLKITIDYSREA